jgi:hypothetical protein
MTLMTAAIRNQESSAQKASEYFVRRVMVLVVRKTKVACSHGSGVFIVGPSKKVAVLTAQHVAVGTGRLGLTFNGHTVGDAITKTISAPQKLDIALMMVHPDVASEVLAQDNAIPLSALDSCDHQDTLGKGTQLVVGGFPIQYQYQAGSQTRNIDIVCFAKSAGCDGTRLSFDWSTVEVRGDSFPAAQLNIYPETRFEQTKPSGLSGAPVFRAIQPQNGEIWVPHTAMRLAAIAVEFKSRRELAIPVWCWRTWVQEMLQ